MDLGTKWLYHNCGCAIIRKCSVHNTDAELARLRAEVTAANEARGKAEQERDHWKDTAEQFSKGMTYYRSLVVRIGHDFGSAAYISDDGSVQTDVLCDKVPELVDALRDEKVKAEAALCRARECLEVMEQSVVGHNCPGFDCVVCAQPRYDMAEALGSPAPCPHEAEVARLTEENKTLWDEVNETRRQDMAPPVDIIWNDEDGREYRLRWDSGDPSVGIHGGWECPELDGLIATMKDVEEIFPNWKSYRDITDCIRVTLAELRLRAGGEEK